MNCEMISTTAKTAIPYFSTFLSMLSSISEEIQRFRNLYVNIPSRSQNALEEHRQIMKAVSDNDEEAAARIMSPARQRLCGGEGVDSVDAVEQLDHRIGHGDTLHLICALSGG